MQPNNRLIIDCGKKTKALAQTVDIFAMHERLKQEVR